MKSPRFASFLRRHGASAALLAMLAIAAEPTWAADARFRFELPAQTMAASLAQFSALTGIEVRVAGGVVDRASTSSLQGDLSPADALARLLAGSGLSHRFVGEKLVVISRAVDDGSRVTGPVRVQGVEGQGGSVAAAGGTGPNGSRDATATEGTHSLTTQAVGIGAKAPLAPKDSTQSVSVITRQRIEDQHLDSLAAALEQTTGITVAQGQNAANNLNPSFYSRGFEITSFQLDGGAPLTKSVSNYLNDYVPVFDLSKYDHVEVLRGASGLYGGVGDPGGVISLQRKRPLDRQQLLVDAELGSFKHSRLSIDSSTPLLDEGRLSLRAVLTHDDSHFFYDTAKSRLDMAYLNLEAKLTNSTILNVGASHTERAGTPWTFGLPRGTDGSDLHLPRDLCLCTDWSRQVTRETEYFTQLRQQLGKDWSLQLNLAQTDQIGNLDSAEADGPWSGIPSDGSGLTVSGARAATLSKQKTVDLVLNGQFEALGRRHQLTLGADRQGSVGKAKGGADSDAGYSFDTAANVNTWDASAYPVSAAVVAPSESQILAWTQSQWGLYGSVRLNPIEALHVTLGARVNGYRTEQVTHYTSGDFQTTTQFSERHTAPPFVGLNYALTPEMSAYASRASIYQSQAKNLSVDLQPMRPTTGTNTELGLKRSDFNGTLNSSLAVFYIVQKNIAVIDRSVTTQPVVPTGLSCCYLNSDDNKRISKGVDLEIAGALTPRWQISAGYTYNINRYVPAASETFETNHSLTTFAPKNSVKLWTTHQLPTASWWSPVQLGAGGRLQSSTHISGSVCNSDFSSCTPADFTQGGYALLDLMARWQIAQNASVQLNVNNALDRTYYQTIGGLQSGSWYGEPRSFRLSLKWAL